MGGQLLLRAFVCLPVTLCSHRIIVKVYEIGLGRCSIWSNTLLCTEVSMLSHEFVETLSLYHFQEWTNEVSRAMCL